MKEYNKIPENKRKKQVYQKKYTQRPQVKKAMKTYHKKYWTKYSLIRKVRRRVARMEE